MAREAAETHEKQKRHVRIELDSAHYPKIFPHGIETGSFVLLNIEGADGDMIPLEESRDGKYIFDGEVELDDAADTFEYQFKVFPASGGERQIPPNGAHRLIYRLPEKVSLRPVPRAPHILPSSDNFRRETHDEVLGIMTAGADALNHPDRERSGEVARSVARFGEVLADRVRNGEEGVREYIADGHRQHLDYVQSAVIGQQKHLQRDEKEVLQDPEQRGNFSKNVFNQLCRKGLLGLAPSDQMRDRAGDFETHAKKHLGKFWPVFDRIRSRYTADSMRRTLEGVVEEVGRELPAEAVGRVVEDRKANADLARRIAKRIGTEMKPAHAEAVKYDDMAKWIGRGGGAALKVGAVMLGFGYPAVAMWMLPSILEASGIDFGQFLKSMASWVPEMGKRGLKEAGKHLPPALWEKIPLKIQRWMKKPDAPILTKIERPDIGMADRFRLFGRNAIPVPWLWEKIPNVNMPKWKSTPVAASRSNTEKTLSFLVKDALPFMAVSLASLVTKVRHLVPKETTRPGELADAEFRKAEGDMEHSCEEILEEMVHRAAPEVTPAPVSPVPGHPTEAAA